MPDEGRDILTARCRQSFLRSHACLRNVVIPDHRHHTRLHGLDQERVNDLFPLAQALRTSRNGDTCSEGAMKEVR